MVSWRRGPRSAAFVRATAGLLGLVAVVTASGCAEHGVAADDKPPDAHLTSVRQAVDRLVRAGTSRARTTLRTTSGGTRVTISGRGRFDYADQRGRLTVTPPDEEHGGSGGGPITELFTPGALHMKHRGAGVPDDKWVQVDTTRLADGNLLANGATDPLRAAELLRGALEVTYEGRERLDGTLVRHFSGTAALDVAAHAAARTDTTSAEQLAAAAEGFEEDTFTFDAWFDRQGRLRKVRHRFPSVPVTSTTAMYDFGVPVSVRLPDPADIYTGRIAPG
jgi:hypothetical protein